MKPNLIELAKSHYKAASGGKRVTLKTVNKAARPLGVQLYRGRGYFYFQAIAENACVSSEGVMVNTLRGLTLEAWVEEAKKAAESVCVSSGVKITRIQL